jgi:hypothetical protein
VAHNSLTLLSVVVVAVVVPTLTGPLRVAVVLAVIAAMFQGRTLVAVCLPSLRSGWLPVLILLRLVPVVLGPRKLITLLERLATLHGLGQYLPTVVVVVVQVPPVAVVVGLRLRVAVVATTLQLQVVPVLPVKDSPGAPVFLQGRMVLVVVAVLQLLVLTPQAELLVVLAVPVLLRQSPGLALPGVAEAVRVVRVLVVLVAEVLVVALLLELLER